MIVYIVVEFVEDDGDTFTYSSVQGKRQSKLLKKAQED